MQQPASRPVCVFFLKNRCQRGSRCPFFHNSGGAEELADIHCSSGTKGGAQDWADAAEAWLLTRPLQEVGRGQSLTALLAAVPLPPGNLPSEAKRRMQLDARFVRGGGTMPGDEFWTAAPFAEEATATFASEMAASGVLSPLLVQIGRFECGGSSGGRGSGCVVGCQGGLDGGSSDGCSGAVDGSGASKSAFAAESSRAQRRKVVELGRGPCDDLTEWRDRVVSYMGVATGASQGGASQGRKHWAWTLPRLCRDVPLAAALKPRARSALEGDARLVQREGSRFGLAAFPPTSQSSKATRGLHTHGLRSSATPWLPHTAA